MRVITIINCLIFSWFIYQNRDVFGFKLTEYEKYDSVKQKLIKHFNVNCSNKSKKIKIGIIDTGFDINNIHLLKNISYYDSFMRDDDGHGTHILSIINMLSCNVEIVFFKVDFKSEKNYLYQLQRAVNSNVDILNLSYGSYEYDKQEFKLLKEAEKKGIILVTAVGNDGYNLNTTKYYPASYELKNIIRVGISTDNKIRKFSNYGNIVDIFIEGDFSLFCNNGQLCNKSGTSQSTAVITSLISNFLSEKDSKDKQIKYFLKKISKNKMTERRLL